MALSSSSSSLSKKRQAVRSISLPTRSHPSTIQVEEELANLKTWELSVSCIAVDEETVCSGLTSLERLYICVDNLLGLPLTQQALSRHQHEKKLIDELLDRSMRLLDVCGAVREVVSQVKEHVRDVQSALRRKKWDFVVDDSFLKKLKKDVKRGVADLKQTDYIYGSKPLYNIDQHVSSIVRVLREVSEVSISVFGLLMSFFSKPKATTTKWSLVSRLIQKGTSGRKDQPRICVEALDCNIEGIENGLECMFRRLIRTRASLLNILSDH